MLLILFAFLMRFVDISKTQGQRGLRSDACNNDNNSINNHNNNKNTLWQHVAKQKSNNANSSSTSSGCDSNASSKENVFMPQNKTAQRQHSSQHHSVTPQQLQQIRYYQHLQQEQLHLLQQQLLQRRRLQQQLREQGVNVNVAKQKRPISTTATLTCNQEYLRQQRLQQQRQHQFQLDNIFNDNDALYDHDDAYNNNNTNNNNNIKNNSWEFNAGFNKGQKFRRGMTEFSTNDNKSHISQPLQNSPRHSQHPNYFNHNHQTQHQNSPQHFANINKHLTHALKQNYNNKNNQQNLTHNSSANINNKNITLSSTPASAANTAATSPTSAIHSPLHTYRNPLNSPNNSPFAYAYYDNNADNQQQLHTKSTAAATTAQHHQQQQQLLQQHLRGSRLPVLAQTQYQQHLNDLFLQQQNLQQYQQKLLHAKDSDDELSEESLKQNVAIVLNNLDRYNNALRSIILNEEVSSNSSVFLDDSFLISSNGNNNFLFNSGITMAAPATPESDYNSNATTPGSRSNMLPHDSNVFSQQQQQQQQHMWFLDYGYRDGCGGMQRSVLSSLSASYNGIGDLIYYEDIAKNMDANLAEVDMESFRAEDMHSLLYLPSYCKNFAGNNHLQQSLMLQQNMLPQITQHGHHVSQTSTTSTDLIDNSICKSELLFSPVKESHISVDSLDLDAYPEDGDIILTCQANKDNYTIAFEGSVLYSDDSFYAEPNEIVMKNKQNFVNLHNNLEDIVKRKSLDMSMSRSEQQFIARNNKLQKSNTIQLQRYPSGNNNTSDVISTPRPTFNCTVRKSSSLPNLRDKKELMTSYIGQQQLNVSQAISTSTVESCKSKNLLPMCQMPISCTSNSVSVSECLTTQCQQQHQKHNHHHHQQQQYQQQHQHRHKHRNCCTTAGNSNNSCSSATIQQQQQQHQQKHAHISGSTSSGSSNPPAFNLVKLFIKQKSSNCSIDDQASAHTCMDVSSGCWPSSDAAGSSSSSSLEQRLRKKSMNDSGKGSALSRHDEEDMHAGDDTTFIRNKSAEHSTPKKYIRTRTDAVFYDDEDQNSSSAGSLTATNSPAHRRRSVPLRNPTICHLVTQHNNGTSMGSLQSSDGSRSNSEQLTQVYVSSGTVTSGANTLERKKSRRTEDTNRKNSTGSCSDMITRSMQTSCGSLSTRSSLSDRFRCVPPSFLEKLNNLGEERQAPIYVIYPNYALPDLGFVKTHASSEMIFSPFNYKMTIGSDGLNGTMHTLKKHLSLNTNDDEILKTMDYKHVVDWQSLATLLPAEYRRRLKHIPQVNNIIQELDSELSQRPLFCMTPPIRRNRPHICECEQYFQNQHTQQQVEEGGGSSSSGSSQQPSSGYRGSSTLLTDSELDNADPLKQMYVYQYDQQRMDSGVETSPATRKTPPQPMPRGILRKTTNQATPRTKRNSMIEEQQTKLSKLEKRRSLQEPPYQHGVGSSDELYEVFEEESTDLYAVPQPRKERLSRKDLDARARARAESFLSSLPRSELKYYAEIASILESSEQQVQYDAAALKKEVSRALSQQKKVSFNDLSEVDGNNVVHQQLLQPDARHKRFTTPPNSPNISIASGGLRMNGHTVPRRNISADKAATLDELEKRKIESNRFKRLQIQWELISKDSSMLKDLANEQQTKSGGSTPTSAPGLKSRIPRPVSYPAGKRTDKTKNDKKSVENSIKPCVSPQIARITTQEGAGKTTRSPSRIVPPKRYSMNSSPVAPVIKSPSTPTGATTGIRARTPNSRIAVTAPNTPKRRVQSPRTVPRVR